MERKAFSLTDGINVRKEKKLPRERAGSILETRGPYERPCFGVAAKWKEKNQRDI